MARLFVVGLVATLLYLFSVTDVRAQPDASAKIHGKIGSGFWSGGSRTSSNGRSYYRPVRPRADYYQPPQGYRGLSYEPLSISSGDMVAVSGDLVRMMKGQEVVGTVPNGLDFRVIKVVNGWLGAIVEVNGKQLRGWVWNGDVNPIAAQARTE